METWALVACLVRTTVSGATVRLGRVHSGMRLHGTLTSPYVRRVRIVAAELGLPVALVQSDPALLPAVTPIWKVPVAELGAGETVLDSGVIVRTLIGRHGWGELAADVAGREIDEANLRTVIDGALDAAINLFYVVRRDGADPQLPYLRKQADRVDSAMGWVSERVVGGSTRADGGFGLTEVALVTTLEWMRFRDAWPVERHPALVAALHAWQGRPSVAESSPTEG
jgi:glutathione S-transferase